MGRYEPLRRYLKDQLNDLIRMSFADIERILDRKLPESADNHRAFWSNNPTNNVMTRAWLEAGFKSEQVDLAGRTLVFRRIEGHRDMPGFEEAQATFAATTDPGTDKLALFGWLIGTVTGSPGVDLSAPADPDWAEIADGKHELTA